MISKVIWMGICWRVVEETSLSNSWILSRNSWKARSIPKFQTGCFCRWILTIIMICWLQEQPINKLFFTI